MLRRLCKDVRFKEEIVLTKKEIKWLNQQHQIYFSWDFIFFLITISLVSAWILPRWQMPFCDWWKNAFDSTLQICSNFNVSTRGSSNIGFTLTYLLWGAFLLNMLRVQKRFFYPLLSLSSSHVSRMLRLFFSFFSLSGTSALQWHKMEKKWKYFTN